METRTILVLSFACACQGGRLLKLKKEATLQEASANVHVQQNFENVPLKSLATLLAAAIPGSAFHAHVPRGTLASRPRASAAVAVTPSTSASTHQIIRNARVIDPRDGSTISPLDGVTGKALCILVPQLAEFDSSELAEQLAAVNTELEQAGLTLRLIGIGDAAAGRRFSEFTGIPLDKLCVDPEASLHKDLNLHRGPGWQVPDSVPDSVLSALLSILPGGVPKDETLIRPHFNAWLNYLAMCAGIAAPGTLAEILRGYIGDESAPERIAEDETVRVGSAIEIGPGVGPVRLGPFRYSQPWADKKGYQRPLELATVRLRNMVEVLSHWDDYVSDPRHIDQRGATYLFDEDGETLFEHRHRGVLTYSRTMARPLAFLAPYIGAKALNPLGLRDDSIAGADAQKPSVPAGGEDQPD